MRIAIITPYHNEDTSVLIRCHESVVAQTCDTIHIMVSDGTPHPMVDTWSNTEHMLLGNCHNDAGATPRAIGALSAFSRGYDAVAFLDADNTYSKNHLEIVSNIMLNNQSDVVAATRNICTSTGDFLYIDRIESTGVDFCDTNCMFIFRSCINNLISWITDANMRLWSDRQFWNSLLQSNLKVTQSLIPTVNYNSRWAWHYQHAGVAVPADSVWIDQDNLGNLIHTVHKNVI